MKYVNSRSTVVDIQILEWLGSQGIQLSTKNGVVPTKSRG